MTLFLTNACLEIPNAWWNYEIARIKYGHGNKFKFQNNNHAIKGALDTVNNESSDHQKEDNPREQNFTYTTINLF